MFVRSWSAVLVLSMGALTVTAGPARAAGQHTVSGTVVGDAHQPLQGVRVTVEGVETSSSRTVQADRSGAWSVSVPDGRYRVRFADPRGIYLGETFDNQLEARTTNGAIEVRVTGHDVPAVDSQLIRVASISGRVVDGATPVAGSGITLEPVIAGDLQHARSGSDGRFSLSDVIPGTYQVIVKDPLPDFGLIATRATITIRSGARVVLPDSQVLGDADLGRMSVDVAAHSGSESASINVWSVNDPVAPISQATMGPPGEPVDFLSVLPGRYRVSLGDNSWVGGTAFENAMTYTVKAGETTKVEATPAEQTELLGYVSTDRGQVLRGALVLVHRMDDPKTIVASAVSFESPGFRIQGLPRTSYGITVIDPGGKYRTTTVDNVDPDFQVVTMPHSPKLATFDEHDSSATFTATGRGARAATYGVLYRADDGEAIASVAANPGAFDQHAPPGTYKVRIGEHSWYGGRSFATAKTITLRRGRTTHVALGGLPANGDLVGSAVTSSGLVLHRAFATIYAADNSHEVIGRVPVDGTFRFDGLPVRSYKIRISDPLGRFATRWFGGGGSFASARAVTPEVSEERLVGTTVLPVAFTVMKPPTITGTAKVGRRLTASDPTFSRAGASMSRLWYRDGRRIRGVTKTTYLLLAKDEGHRITVKVTARKQDEKTLVVSSKSTPRVAGR